MKETKPLAFRKRPTTPGELVGQAHIWREGGPLWLLAEQGTFHALLFWGPPGTGKTSLAHVIASQSGRPVRVLSAVSHGVKEIRQVLQESSERMDQGDTNLVLFMDEIHRLNKGQQDVLLPALEEGMIKFIGATTENPSFAVNHAILSRSLVYQFRLLDADAIKGLLLRILESDYSSRQLGDEVIEVLVHAAAGDARKALNLLEAVMAATTKKSVALDDVKEVLGSLQIPYDRDGDAHYDNASALIKSIRASHPDAALHYLGRMLSGGEDPRFIARRLVIAASEDIGNANPTALLMAQAGMNAAERIGMPEMRIILSQVTTYLASSPKSNRSYLAIDKALSDIEKFGLGDVPLHLRNAPTKYMKDIGYGKEYVYPHDELEKARTQTYLPTHLQGRKYYQPLPYGVEGQLQKNLEKLRPKAD